MDRKTIRRHPIAARQAYRRFVRAGVDGTLLWEALRDQVYLGEDKFLARMEKLAADQAWLYLLRRAVNISLREAAGKVGVSPDRISQI